MRFKVPGINDYLDFNNNLYRSMQNVHWVICSPYNIFTQRVPPTQCAVDRKYTGYGYLDKSEVSFLPSPRVLTVIEPVNGPFPTRVAATMEHLYS